MFRLIMVQRKAFGCFNTTLAPANKIFGLVKLIFGGFHLYLHIIWCDPHVMSLQKHLFEWMCQLVQLP